MSAAEFEATMKCCDPKHCQCDACKGGVIHASDCAVHNEPAYRNGPCDCGAEKGT